jgi:hypothetical protein
MLRIYEFDAAPDPVYCKHFTLNLRLKRAYTVGTGIYFDMDPDLHFCLKL